MRKAKKVKDDFIIEGFFEGWALDRRKLKGTTQIYGI